LSRSQRYARLASLVFRAELNVNPARGDREESTPLFAFAADHGTRRIETQISKFSQEIESVGWKLREERDICEVQDI
jgi:hypothetical protein